jgi:hypothetical protein
MVRAVAWIDGDSDKQFQEKCETVYPGKARSAFPEELRQNKKIAVRRFRETMNR